MPTVLSLMIRFWRFLGQTAPDFLKPAAISALKDIAEQGSEVAAEQLAQIVLVTPSATLGKLAAQAVTAFSHPAAISAVWAIGEASRSQELIAVLEKLAKPAQSPDRLFVFSRLVLVGYDNDLERCSADQLAFLVQYAHDPDETIQRRVRTILHHLKRPAAVVALCEMWHQSRDPILADTILTSRYIIRRPSPARVATLLLLNHLSPILSGDAATLEPLLDASSDSDPLLSQRAQQCLPNLQNQALINAVCAHWVKTNDITLTNAIVQARYLPTGPEDVRLLVALKTKRVEIGKACPVEQVPLLVSACANADEDIRASAQECALALHQAAQEKICAMVIENNSEPAARIAKQAGYLPKDSETRALFLFLTDQIKEYQDFDFDHSLLKAAFERANPDIRSRLAAKIRASGSLQFLDILSGINLRISNNRLNAEEADTLIRILTENKQYDRLWRSLVDLSPYFALQALDHLNHAGWSPEQPDDAQIYQALLEINLPPVTPNIPYPMAVQCAAIRVQGRINEIAFSPVQPWIAIGTGQRKVVVWNFRTGTTHRVLSGFEHSIGQVGFTSSGRLLFAERSIANTRCQIYSWENENLEIVGAHAGSVTALEPLDNNQVITAGKDSTIRVWDLRTFSLLQEKQYYTWPRHLIASHNQRMLALLTDILATYDLPHLSRQQPQPYRRRSSKIYQRSVTRCASFSPDDNHLLVGQNNGQVCIYWPSNHHDPHSQVVLTQHSGAVQQVLFSPTRPVVATAGAEGQLRFFDWPSFTIAGTIDIPERRLTALHQSPDGAFLAIGTDDAAMTLWDTRITKLPTWLFQPISTLTPLDLSTIRSLLQSTNLPAMSRQYLVWLQMILQHHYRYDIQLDEAVTIQPGEFDILLDS